jgi:predicted nucleotidyltransferase component of viral defense system
MYEDQVALLLDVIEVAMRDDRVALKGGTAINLFLEEMPRFSVDIDLCYLPIESREKSLRTINEIIQKMTAAIEKKSKIIAQINYTDERIAKQVVVKKERASIKIEINHVLRGHIYETQTLALCDTAQEKFQTYVEVQALSTEEIYVGKFCAALDRQHPRDLFDVMNFFERHTFSARLKKAFLIYLISGNRPISEMIHPNALNQREAYENEFRGMTNKPVTYEELDKARSNLINLIDKTLTQEDKEFLLSIKEGKPNWSYIEIENIDKFPAIQWKLKNIKNMSAQKRSQAIENLKRKLRLENIIK